MTRVPKAPDAQTERRSWRDVLAIHPACELLPSPSEDELKALAVDIAENGQLEPIRLTPSGSIIDGRSRLDAMEMIGVRTVAADGTLVDAVKSETEDGDPYALVMSLNVRRRQLTRAQKRKAALELLRQGPERSDRRIARLAGVDHKTVSRLRAEGETTGEIPRLDSTVGEDQKTRRRASGVKVFDDAKELNGMLVDEAKAKGSKAKHGRINVGTRARELAVAGDVPATIARKLTDEAGRLTFTATDAVALLQPPDN